MNNWMQFNSIAALLKLGLGCLFWVTLMGSHGDCGTVVVVDDPGHSGPYSDYYNTVYGTCGEVTGSCGCWGPVMLGSYSNNSYCDSGYDVAVGCFDGLGQPVWCAGGYQAWGLQCACY